MHSDWVFNGKRFEMPDETDVGFVYLIEEIETGMKYIGKKNFWVYVKRKPRGQKRAKRVQRESDWRTYHGSSNELKEAKQIGKSYRRTILHICKSKAMMNYLELKEQIIRDVLFDKSYYNSFIGTRISRNQFKNEILF